MRDVLNMAHHRAAIAFGMIVLVRGETIVNHHDDADVQMLRQALDEGSLLRVCFAQIARTAVAQCVAPLGGHGQVFIAWTFLPNQLMIFNGDTALERLPVVHANQAHRHRVQHLIAEHQSTELLRQFAQPCESVLMRDVGQCFGDGGALLRLQCGR